MLFDLNGFKGYNDTYGHSAGDVLLARLGSALRTRSADAAPPTAWAATSSACSRRCPPGQVDAFSAHCATALADHGQGSSITAAHGAVALPDESRDTVGALDARRRAHVPRKKAAGAPAAQPVGRRADGGDRGARARSSPRTCARLRSSPWPRRVELGVDGGELEALRHAAALHDIGKMAIPESILEKPGPLTSDEWALIRQHTLIGERILATAPALERSARLVRWSHERVDGTGYPDGLAGDEIPLGSRIIFVADAFDAMFSRPQLRTHAIPRRRRSPSCAAARAPSSTGGGRRVRAGAAGRGSDARRSLSSPCRCTGRPR